MPTLRLHITPFARRQIKEVVQYYVTHASPAVATRFRDEFKAATQLLVNNPGAGSLRLAHLLSDFELRTWTLSRFPFRIFFKVDAQELRVIAVAHERRDITPSLLGQATK